MSKQYINKVSEKGDRNIVYLIEKEFSINNVEFIKKELETIIQKNASFVLQIKNIDTFDLSAIQVLSSLKNKMKDNITFDIDLKDDTKTIIEHSGFDYLINK